MQPAHYQTETIEGQEDTNASMRNIQNVESARTNDGLNVAYNNMDTTTSELVRLLLNTYKNTNTITKYKILVPRIQHMRM